MARVFMDGFETGQPQASATGGIYNGGLWQLWHTGINVVSTNHVKTGNYSFRIAPGSLLGDRRSWATRDLGVNLKEHYGRIELYVSDMDSTATECVHFNDDLGNRVAAIRLTRTTDFVNIHLYIGTTEVATLNEAFIYLGPIVRIEWRLVVDEISGIFEVKLNGNSLLSFTGNTKGSNEENIRVLGLGEDLNRNNTSFSYYFDDVAVNDTTGTVNNSWVGRGYIYLAKPKGIGNYSQWTPSNETYDNWEMVNTIPDDGDTTYVESETPGHRDSYEMETIEDALGAPLEESVVKAVQHLFKGRYEDTHAAVEPFVRIGAVDYDLDPATDMQNAYYRYWDRVLNVNPATDVAWTAEAFDGMEAGVKFDEGE